MKRKKLKSLKSLKNKAWTLFSKNIRKNSADWRGNTSCYTCLVLLPYQELQAGHFIHGKLDFDPRNIKPQCARCNLYLSGNLGLYAERLIQENGLDWIKQLRIDAYRKGNDYKRAELEEIINQYENP